MNFLDTGKDIGFMGTPKSKVAPDLSITDMCALAWVRSNFPPEGGPEILESICEDTKVTVVLADNQEVLSFHFKTALGATRAFSQLPPATGIDMNEVQRLMNFGHDPQETLPAPVVSRVPALG